MTTMNKTLKETISIDELTDIIDTTADKDVSFKDFKSNSFINLLHKDKRSLKKRQYTISKTIFTDEIIEDEIINSKRTTIAILGSAFDTTFYRLNMKPNQFIIIDSPEDVVNRKKYIRDDERIELLPFDICDTTWTKMIVNNSNSFVFAFSNAIDVYDDSELKPIIGEICKRFKRVKIIFTHSKYSAVDKTNSYKKSLCEYNIFSKIEFKSIKLPEFYKSKIKKIMRIDNSVGSLLLCTK